MAWLTSAEKEKLIKKTSKNYVFSRFLLFFSISLLFLSVGFILFSFLKTMFTYANLHNLGKSTGDTWIEISHYWWSPIKVLNESQYQPGDSVILSFSIFTYVMMGFLSLTIITTITSIVLVARFKSPKKIAPDVEALDDDYWKRQIAKINRIHNLEIDAWQEYVEVEKLRQQERIEEMKKRRQRRARQAKTKKKNKE